MIINAKRRIFLSVFAFDSRFDYQSGYLRYDVDYKEEDTLLDFLGNIPTGDFGNKEFGYDKEFLHVRINDKCVFDNLKVSELVKHFGSEWTLDPLSKKYCKKDLLLNYDMALNFYEGFFASASFIYPGEKEELKNFISMNFISEHHSEDYFGDGFFLYLKWLMNRHPMQKRHILKTMASKRGGIMDYTPTASLMYPPNNSIDVEIENLQTLFLNASKCPVKKGEWVGLGNKIEGRYKLKPIHKLPNITEKSRCPIMSGKM
ncbi:DUF5644 domain-containing protein [Helicobacter sp. 11S02629-2]|uniref:DUF5644 domain-containing protein n=1 Tax=Helicobacter sp. 11S02629-2 TaxID=1476195 RepID=UPI000BA6DEE7|nr:DUF5644 domain-containing protein [Helicobacter sp. 11S02629-2]PAF44964.1 hypothetical protein BKH40_04565 [Helicobacter sp. 11S02629-2]